MIDRPLGLLGGAFLLWLGLRGLRAGAAPKAAGLAATGVWPTLAATFLLTLANPVTILSFAAIFAGLGLARDAGVSEALQLVSGVFAGSLLWWALLSGGVAAAHRQLPAAFSLWVARGSGAVMIGFGLWALALGLAG
ncbi:lysine exporter protein LysE/YggA [Rhodobacter ferrooxidans]|uniref:Lysine exporter protein LysE/YggA n=1 Tax=Rhodobacter ferrooxidans TaxID=371731 RepID=C8RZN4_9RHOB|nr:lysine exporter protein LysE/YggA [Rhodobacter sp. SW2]